MDYTEIHTAASCSHPWSLWVKRSMTAFAGRASAKTRVHSPAYVVDDRLQQQTVRPVNLHGLGNFNPQRVGVAPLWNARGVSTPGRQACVVDRYGLVTPVYDIVVV